MESQLHMDYVRKIVSYINEHRSVEDGVLIWEYNIGEEQDMRGAGGDVTGYRVC